MIPCTEPPANLRIPMPEMIQSHSIGQLLTHGALNQKARVRAVTHGAL